MMGRVSIIIPVYNRQRWVGETLDSLIAQRYNDWEAVVCDDGSTDKTPDILARYTDCDARIHWFKRGDDDRRGAASCRNLALNQACGDFVLFLDSDDLLPEDCLEKRVAMMQKHPDIDMGVFGCARFTEHPQTATIYQGYSQYPSDLDNFLHQPIPWITSSPLWRRPILGTKPFNESLSCNQDWELHLRFLLQGVAIRRFGDIAPYLQRQGHDTISSRLHTRTFMCSFLDAAMLVGQHPHIMDQTASFRNRLWRRVRFGVARLMKHRYYSDVMIRLDALAAMPLLNAGKKVEIHLLRKMLSFTHRKDSPLPNPWTGEP